MKKAIRYLRFSKDGQSNHSIDRQDMVTSFWSKNAEVEITDTFIDEGYSATNFDRPDIKKLFEFIKKNSRNIDYLIVSELTRFSREAGDAMNMMKKIQTSYDIRIVSAQKGTIYDINDSSSFFMMGLEFLLGNSENIKRRSDIRGGIYTAKAREGRYIYNKPPYGYFKNGEGKNSELVIDQEKAAVVRFIFDAYLSEMPMKTIQTMVRSKGWNFKGNSVIQDLLANPVYAGYQMVTAWNNNPGGLFKSKHEGIITFSQWSAVQDKIAGKDKQKISVSDEFPLRGTLKCHCGKALTGAPSMGRHGTWYNYYKCQTSSKHNNINTKKAHEQLSQVFDYLSLPERLVTALSTKSEQLLNEQFAQDHKDLMKLKTQLTQTTERLISVEEKFIANQMHFETYNRWFADLNREKNTIESKIAKLQDGRNGISELVKGQLPFLSDMGFVWNKSKTLEKQQLIRIVFDNRLYYQEKTYRTPYLLELLSHNQLILKQKQLLLIEKKEDSFTESSRVEPSGVLSNPLISLLTFFQSMKTA